MSKPPLHVKLRYFFMPNHLLCVVGCGIMGKAQGREQASLDFCWSTVASWDLEECRKWVFCSGIGTSDCQCLRWALGIKFSVSLFYLHSLQWVRSVHWLFLRAQGCARFLTWSFSSLFLSIRRCYLRRCWARSPASDWVTRWGLDIDLKAVCFCH